MHVGKQKGEPAVVSMESCSVPFKALMLLLLLATCLVTALFIVLNDNSEDGWVAISGAVHFKTTRLTSSNGTDDVFRNLTILLWHWPFGRRYPLEGNVCWDSYYIPHCQLTDQRSLYSDADAVVFHHRELQDGQQRLPLHLSRPTHQKWVWMSLESPENNRNLHNYRNVFNWTMSYRRDADITIPYGELRENCGNCSSDTVEDLVPQNKSTLVCWVVSNFNSHHRRSQVYTELKRTIPVEVYGRWKGRELARDNLLPTVSRCYFYLSFENSISKDYITEKLWKNAYQAGTVPVVLGPPLEDYQAVAAPKSFIHVDEFASVPDLGRFLHQLVLDKERYAGYLAWRQKYRVKLFTDWRERLCRICSHYHNLPPQQFYPDLEAWVWD